MKEYYTTKIKYRIVCLGDDRYLAWDDDGKRFVPAGMLLYVTTYDDIDSVFKAIRKVKRLCSGWANEIYIDSFTVYQPI